MQNASNPVRARQAEYKMTDCAPIRKHKIIDRKTFQSDPSGLIQHAGLFNGSLLWVRDLSGYHWHDQVELRALKACFTTDRYPN